MAAIDSYHPRVETFVGVSTQAVNVIQGVGRVASGARKVLISIGHTSRDVVIIAGGIVLGILLIIPSVLFVMIAMIGLWGWLAYMNQSLQQLSRELRIPVDFQNSQDTKEYVFFREQYDSLTGVYSRLQSMKASELLSTYQDAAPWLVRPYIHQISMMLNTLQVTQADMSDTLQKMDAGAPVSGLFIPAKEAELWQNRNKAYSYLV